MEINFTKKLPSEMALIIVKNIHGMYKNKLPLFDDENMDFFEQFMLKAKFRKCIFGELFNSTNEDKSITMIYSGKIGSFINNLTEYFENDYINELDVGQEFGH